MYIHTYISLCCTAEVTMLFNQPYTSIKKKRLVDTVKGSLSDQLAEIILFLGQVADPAWTAVPAPLQGGRPGRGRSWPITVHKHCGREDPHYGLMVSVIL